MLGPLSFNLSLRDSFLTILFFNLLSTLPAGIMATMGPKTGMRQMILARYCFGYVCVESSGMNMLTVLGGISSLSQCCSTLPH